MMRYYYVCSTEETGFLEIREHTRQKFRGNVSWVLVEVGTLTNTRF